MFLFLIPPMGSWTELIWARQHLLSFDYPVSLCGERRKKKKKRGRRKRRRRRGVRRGVKQCARLYGNAPIADADNGVLTARRLFWRFRRESEKKLKSKRERERETRERRRRPLDAPPGARRVTFATSPAALAVFQSDVINANDDEF